ALIIKFVGKLFWWLGVILFICFAFNILVELIVAGSVLFLMALILKWLFPLFTDYRVLRSDRFGELQKSFGSFAGSTGIYALVQLDYIFITFVLGYFLFD